MANNLYKAVKLQGWVHLRRDLIVAVVALYGRNMMRGLKVDPETRRYFDRMVRFDEPSRRYILDESLATEKGVIKYWKMVNEMPGNPKFDAPSGNTTSGLSVYTPTAQEKIRSNHDLEQLLRMLVNTWPESSREFQSKLDPTRDYMNFTRPHESPAITTGRVFLYTNVHTTFVHLLLGHCDYNGFEEARRVVMKDYQKFRDWDRGYECALRRTLFY
jgi:hypothetical protein